MAGGLFPETTGDGFVDSVGGVNEIFNLFSLAASRGTDSSSKASNRFSTVGSDISWDNKLSKLELERSVEAEGGVGLEE